MGRWRAILVGAGVGVALGMPLFEVFLLTALAVDGGVFDAVVAIRYFSHPANLVTLLVLLHLVTAVVGAAVGYFLGRVRPHPRLRVIPGGRR